MAVVHFYLDSDKGVAIPIVLVRRDKLEAGKLFSNLHNLKFLKYRMEIQMEKIIWSTCLLESGFSLEHACSAVIWIMLIYICLIL